jgi:mannose-1-phosphate guanylyltransferase
LDCIVLAAGQGRRLSPLTAVIPKPLLPVANRPLLEWNLASVRAAGLTKVGVNLYHGAPALKAAFADGARYGVQITWRTEQALRGPAGAMRLFEDLLVGDVVVISGDALHDIDLAQMLAVHRDSRAPLTVAVAEVEDAGRYGVASVNDQGFVSAFEEKPAWAVGRRGLVSCGVYCLDARLVAEFPPECIYDFGANLIPELVARGGRVRAFRHDGYWTDIGTPSTFRQANLDAASARVKAPGCQSVAADADGVVHGRNVRVGVGARIIGPAVIGDGVTLGPRSLVVRSVLLAESTLGADQCLVDGILTPSHLCVET